MKPFPFLFSSRTIYIYYAHVHILQCHRPPGSQMQTRATWSSWPAFRNLLSILTHAFTIPPASEGATDAAATDTAAAWMELCVMQMVQGLMDDRQQVIHQWMEGGYIIIVM